MNWCKIAFMYIYIGWNICITAFLYKENVYLYIVQKLINNKSLLTHTWTDCYDILIRKLIHNTSRLIHKLIYLTITAY